MPCKITLEHVRRNEARIVCKGGYFQAEWSPPWTQLRIPDAPQRKQEWADMLLEGFPHPEELDSTMRCDAA